MPGLKSPSHRKVRGKEPRYRHSWASDRTCVSRLLRIAIVLSAWSGATSAQEPLIEEILVTAQRVEENASDVPAALNAFSEPGLDDRLIDPQPCDVSGEGEVECRERLGGMLKFYYRKAA